MTRGTISWDSADDWDDNQRQYGFLHSTFTDTRADQLCRGYDPSLFTNCVGLWAFDEDSGTTLNNYGHGTSASGSGNLKTDGGDGDGDYYNPTLNEPGPLATSAVHFKGSDSYASVDFYYDTSNAIDTDISLIGWVKIPEGQETSDYDYHLFTFDRNEYFRFSAADDRSSTDGIVGFDTTDSGGSTHDFTSDTQINDGEWHFIGATYEYATGHKKIFIDGEKDIEALNAHGDNTALGTGTTRYPLICENSEATSYGGSGGSDIDIHVGWLGYWEGYLISEQEMRELYSAVKQPTFITNAQSP